MTPRAKNRLTLFIAGPIVLLIPVLIYFLLRLTLAGGVTQDNASLVFQQFQIAIDHGEQIRDRVTAEAVARRAFLEAKMGPVLVDGWGLIITSLVHSYQT